VLKRPLRPNRRAAHRILSAVPLAKGPATSAPLDWPPPTAAAARTHHSAKPPAPTTYSWPGFTLAPAAWAPARATRGKHTCAGEEGEEQGADKLSRHLFLVLPVLPGIHKLTAPTTARNMHARRQCASGGLRSQRARAQFPARSRRRSQRKLHAPLAGGTLPPRPRAPLAATTRPSWHMRAHPPVVAHVAPRGGACRRPLPASRHTAAAPAPAAAAARRQAPPGRAARRRRPPARPASPTPPRTLPAGGRGEHT